MSNDQTHLDGTARDVVVIPFDAEGNMGDFERIGSALDWRSAALLASEMGYRIAPEGEGYDIGHIANSEGPDAYGVPVLV